MINKLIDASDFCWYFYVQHLKVSYLKSLMNNFYQISNGQTGEPEEESHDQIHHCAQHTRYSDLAPCLV